MNFSISELSKRIGISRRHVYNLFDNPNVPIETIIKIGKVIKYDFSNDVKEIEDLPQEIQLSVSDDNDVFYNDASFWRKKYISLLEKHRLLLDDKLKDYFDLDE